jgi:hypothetical protein
LLYFIFCYLQVMLVDFLFECHWLQM